MNIHTSNLEKNAEHPAIEQFIKLLKSGFQNPENMQGSAKVIIPEQPHAGFSMHFKTNSLQIERNNTQATTGTTLTIPLHTLERIIKEAQYLDFRDPEIIGTITIEGNLGYANHLGKACLQPSDFVAQRFAQIEQLHKAQQFKHLDKLETLHQPSQVQLLEALDTQKPFVISGLAPNGKKWNLDTLVEHYGNEIVRVRSAQQQQTMAEFVAELKQFQAAPNDEMIEGFVKPYTEGATLPEAMWDEFGPLFFNREDFIPPQLWLGAVPTHIPTSSLHRDPHTGFLLQVMGRKRLDLYSADQAELLYPHKAYSNYQPCWFKPEAPDYNTYPMAKQAKCISASIGPGELLVQPAGWFHQVYAEDSPNMSVSYFWRY